MKEIIDLSQLVINDHLKETIVREKLVIVIRILFKNSIINDKIKVTMGEKKFKQRGSQ